MQASRSCCPSLERKAMLSHKRASSRHVEPRISLVKKALLPLSLLVFTSAGCIWGVDTVRITTDPPGADLYCNYYEDKLHPFSAESGRWVRSYGGKTPVSVPAPWAVPWQFPSGHPLGGQKPFKVVIEKAGYPVITEAIPSSSRGLHHATVQRGPQATEQILCKAGHRVSVRKGSRFGWGSTHEYLFKLDDYGLGVDR